MRTFGPRSALRPLAGRYPRERLFNSGVETVGSTPEQFAATIRADIARTRKVITEAGIREQ